MLAGAQQHALCGAGIHVDVRIGALLADQLQLGQALHQGGGDGRALAEQHQRFGVLEALGEDLDILGVVAPDGDIVAGQLAVTGQRAHGVVKIIQD